MRGEKDRTAWIANAREESHNTNLSDSVAMLIKRGQGEVAASQALSL